jgi:exopolysaccharide production protein ExoQ
MGVFRDKENMMLVPLNSSRTEPLRVLAITWLLLLPLIFLAVHGQLWFLISNANQFAPGGVGTFGVQRTGLQATIDTCIKIAVIGLFYAFALSRIQAIRGLLRSNRALIAIIILVFVSMAWSQFPATTIQFGIILASNIVFALFLSVKFDADEQMRLFALVGFVLSVATLAAVFLLPNQGIDYKEGGTTAWQGIFNHKNDCAIVLSYLLTCFLFSDTLRQNSPRLRILGIGLLLFVIAMSESRTGWILASTAVLYMLVVRTISRFDTKARQLLYLVAIVLVITTIILILLNAGDLFRAMGKSENATGRTGIWFTALTFIRKRPLLGYGYHAFFMGMQGESATTSLASLTGIPMMHAQSGYLDTWLELGLLGLGALLCTILRAIKNAAICLTRSNSSAAQWYLSIVLLTVLANIGERNLMDCNFLDWVMYLVAYIGLNKEVKAIRWREISRFSWPIDGQTVA